MTDVETPTEAATAVSVAPLPEKKVSDAPVWLNLAALFLSFLGIFVAATLSLSHALALRVPCGDNSGCEILASNPASMILGIPVAYLGLGGYIVLAAISAIRAFRGLARTSALGMTALGMSGVGALFSFYLQFIAYTQIHAFCPWCLTSAIAMCLLFLTEAGIAQMDVPVETADRRHSTVVTTVGLTFIALLGIGYQSLHFVDTAPKLNLSNLNPGDTLEQELIVPDALKLGPDSAPVKLVEFSDLVCPTCKEYYPRIKDLVNNSHGNLQLIFRDRPLIHNPEHKMATPAAFISEYAKEKGKGWEFVDEMYKHDNPDLQTLDSLYAVAKSVGLDLNDVKSRMKDTDPAWKRVLRDLDLAQRLGIEETPTFVLFAKGYPPLPLHGSELMQKIQEPPYSDLLKGNGK